MAAVQAILGRSIMHYRVTVGAQGGSTRYGSIYPGGAITPDRLWSQPNFQAFTQGPDGFDDFEVKLNPLIAQNWFRFARVQDQAGNYRNYDSASAFYTTNTSWEWGSGSDPVWNAASVGNTFNLEVW